MLTDAEIFLKFGVNINAPYRCSYILPNTYEPKERILDEDWKPFIDAINERYKQ